MLRGLGLVGLCQNSVEIDALTGVLSGVQLQDLVGTEPWVGPTLMLMRTVELKITLVLLKILSTPNLGLE